MQSARMRTLSCVFCVCLLVHFYLVCCCILYAPRWVSRLIDWYMYCNLCTVTQRELQACSRNGILVCASLQKKSSFRSRSFVFQVHQYFLVVLYDRTIILPPGIRNEGNICYAISVVQCLFNHSTFRDSLAEVCAFHEEDGHVQCEMCLQKGMVLSSKNEVINT